MIESFICVISIFASVLCIVKSYEILFNLKSQKEMLHFQMQKMKEYQDKLADEGIKVKKKK